MDAEQFDRITRSLASNLSRRSVLGGLASLLAGTALAARPLSGEAAKGGPNPCNIYCAGESGPRGAQCRQACKECGGPTTAGFCYDKELRSYTCCPEGTSCFRTYYGKGEGVICCESEPQICGDANGPFCCAEGTQCAGDGLCCPGEAGGCNGPDGFVCGASCYDLCTYGERCGESNDNGECVDNACYDPCFNEVRCGEQDGFGNCIDSTCYDPTQETTVCGSSCYDPCSNGDRCGEQDGFGNCIDGTCYDPTQGTTICGSSCYDGCIGENRCGPSDVNSPYCDDASC